MSGAVLADLNEIAEDLQKMDLNEVLLLKHQLQTGEFLARVKFPKEAVVEA